MKQFSSSKLTLIFMLAFGLALTALSMRASAEPSAPSIRQGILEAFASIQKVEEDGGNVSQLVILLNRAIRLEREGELTADPVKADQLYDEAQGIVDEVMAMAPRVREEGITARSNRTIWTAVDLISLVLISLFVYILGPRIFWVLWLRTHRSWRVRAA